MIFNLKKVIAGSFVFLTLFTANAAFISTLNAQERFLVEECEIPQENLVGNWQCQLEFPDRQKEIDDTLVQNSLYTFDYFYGQGQLFVQVPECVKSFSLFVNPLPIEDRTKITNDTLFDVASCTKALAANFALEYLISNNQLSLDEFCRYRIIWKYPRRFLERFYRPSGNNSR